MNILYLRQAYLDRLKVNIKNNITLYQQNEPWLDKYFEDDNWFLSSNIHVDDIKLIEPKGGAEHFDFENAKIIYTALKQLSIVQATDERLWSYLSHVTFWKYMRSRWPVEDYIHKEKPWENIRERYFFMPNRDRALIRNGIARLWWYGYVSYDENRNDPFELTKILLSKLDIAQQLLERSFSRNTTITKTILSVLADLVRRNKPLPNRKEFRELTIYINWLGGVTILDALDASDIEKIVLEKLDKTA